MRLLISLGLCVVLAGSACTAGGGASAGMVKGVDKSFKRLPGENLLATLRSRKIKSEMVEIVDLSASRLESVSTLEAMDCFNAVFNTAMQYGRTGTLTEERRFEADMRTRIWNAVIDGRPQAEQTAGQDTINKRTNVESHRMFRRNVAACKYKSNEAIAAVFAENAELETIFKDSE